MDINEYDLTSGSKRDSDINEADSEDKRRRSSTTDYKQRSGNSNNSNYIDNNEEGATDTTSDVSSTEGDVENRISSEPGYETDDEYSVGGSASNGDSDAAGSSEGRESSDTDDSSYDIAESSSSNEAEDELANECDSSDVEIDNSAAIGDVTEVKENGVLRMKIAEKKINNIKMRTNTLQSRSSVEEEDAGTDNSSQCSLETDDDQAEPASVTLQPMPEGFDNPVARRRAEVARVVRDREVGPRRTPPSHYRHPWQIGDGLCTIGFGENTLGLVSPASSSGAFPVVDRISGVRSECPRDYLDAKQEPDLKRICTQSMSDLPTKVMSDVEDYHREPQPMTYGEQLLARRDIEKAEDEKWNRAFKRNGYTNYKN